MAWTDEQLDRLHDKMALAKRQGTWLSAAEAGIVLALIAAIRRIRLSKGWNGVPHGPPPTIGYIKSHGVSGLVVTCEHCRSRRRLAFVDLGLPDSTVFVEIPKVRGFRCVRCGRRVVTVIADWPNPMEVQLAKSRALKR